MTTGMLAAVLVGPALASTHAVDTIEKDRVAGTFGTDDSWATLRGSSNSAAADLEKDPAAASRARLRLPLEVRPCVAEVEAAANGSRDMIMETPIYMPLREGTFQVTSPFGYRMHPVLGYWKMHEGVDYAAPEGTPLYAVSEGVVTETATDSGMGFYTVISHELADGTKYSSWYLHQWQEDSLVQVGQTVKAGQQIGAVGNSGTSTGAHLHLEIHDSSDTPVDPAQWLEEHGAMYLGEGC